MRFISTRGEAPALGFADVLTAGPAPDGGLYMPESWPRAVSDLESAARLSFADNACKLLWPYVEDALTREELREDVEGAYAAFSHKEIAPLVEIGQGRYLLELFHGPTLAFKDVAMQLIGRMLARVLKKRGARATVIAATSGDTGSAAIAALRGLENVDVVVLHPHGRVSEVQRRQMTTVLDENVHNIALEGTFDDTQNIVKALFADAKFAEAQSLTAVNSINFARIAAQCVYYVTSAAALRSQGAPNFVVPTGNFGDVFAGEAARHMGLTLSRLVVATNANDILARALNTGAYRSGTAQPTLSPSMDIQVASNFERALFEASGRDAKWLKTAMRNFSQTRELTVPARVSEGLRSLYLAASADDHETIAAIGRIHAQTGRIIDPHTAVGVAAAAKLTSLSAPVVFLATAHPAKFPEAVERAIGRKPDLPSQLRGIAERKERYEVLPNDVAAVRSFIAERAMA